MNVYVGQRVQGRHPQGGTPERMKYAPLEMMFPPLEMIFPSVESELSPLGCPPLETEQPLPGCTPLEVGR